MRFHSHVLNKLPLKLKLPSTLSRNTYFSSVFPTCSHSCNLLQLCTLCHTLSQTKQVHAFALLHGFLPRSVSLCASFILQYASFGHPSASLLLFQQSLPHSRSAFLWNTLIRANSIAGVFDGFSTYNTMVRAGVKPDECTYPFVLKGCADFRAVYKGREVHGVVFKLGFDGDVFVGNTLLAFYGNCGLFADAMRVFDEMPERDKVSWNTIIGLCSLHGFYQKALGSFRAMVAAVPDIQPDLVTVLSVLPVCAETEDEVMARIIHCYALKAGLLGHVKVGNALVDVYGKCGSEKASKKVFDEIDDRNVVSWNSIITSFSFRGRYVDALDVFRLMIGTGVRPNSVTTSSMLPVLGELGLFKLGMEIHGFSLRMAIESDIFIANSLIDMYAKSGSSRRASIIFNKMEGRSIVSWNSMIANFAQNRLEFEAVELVRQMQAKGETPNSVTFTNVLPACARLGFLNVGKEIHAKIIRVGSACDLFVSNALTDMYSKCGYLNIAQNVFNISFRDEVSYNVLIIGYSRTNDCSESLRLFSEMRLAGMSPDIVSFMGVISACANLASLRQGKEVHGLLMRKLFHTHLFVANSLLDLYTRCGRIDLATKVFDRIKNKDAASWNTMILGYGMLGELDTAIDLFETMKEDGVEYDSVSFIAVLSACSHGGLIEKGRKYFKMMHDLNIEPAHTHHACMVDLLGRAGLMEEVVDLIRGLSIVPDTNIWGALLGACRIHGNIELGHWAAEHLFKLKPQHCGYYILLSNMYAEAERWDEANKVRELMKSRGAKKNPGCSWVQIGDQVHAFLVGEKIDSLDDGFWARLREAASLEKHVLLKKLRDALQSLKGRVAGRNKDNVAEAIAMIPNEVYRPSVEACRDCCRQIKKGYQRNNSPRYYISILEGDNSGMQSETEEPRVVVQMDTQSPAIYQKSCLDNYFDKPIQVTGDVRVIFYKKMIGGCLFCCCFNTAFIRNSLLQLTIQELDKVGNKGRSICGPDFCLELLFGPANTGYSSSISNDEHSSDDSL